MLVAGHFGWFLHRNPWLQTSWLVSQASSGGRWGDVIILLTGCAESHECKRESHECTREYAESHECTREYADSHGCIFHSFSLNECLLGSFTCTRRVRRALGGGATLL